MLPSWWVFWPPWLDHGWCQVDHICRMNLPPAGSAHLVHPPMWKRTSYTQPGPWRVHVQAGNVYDNSSLNFAIITAICGLHNLPRAFNKIFLKVFQGLHIHFWGHDWGSWYILQVTVTKSSSSLSDWTGSLPGSFEQHVHACCSTSFSSLLWTKRKKHINYTVGWKKIHQAT